MHRQYGGTTKPVCTLPALLHLVLPALRHCRRVHCNSRVSEGASTCDVDWECSLLSPPRYGCSVSLLQWCWSDTIQSRSSSRGWAPITAPSSKAASSSLQSTCASSWSREYTWVVAKRQPGLLQLPGCCRNRCCWRSGSCWWVFKFAFGVFQTMYADNVEWSLRSAPR